MSIDGTAKDRSDVFDRVFKALGNATRRTILDTLRDQPRTTGALVGLFPDIDRCTVMLHLKVLEDAGLVIAERRGRERLNHLNPLPIHDIHERWIGPHAKGAVARLSKLKAQLEADTAVLLRKQEPSACSAPSEEEH